MSHIAILLPKDDLVLQAGELAKGHYSIAEIRQIETEKKSLISRGDRDLTGSLGKAKP